MLRVLVGDLRLEEGRLFLPHDPTLSHIILQEYSASFPPQYRSQLDNNRGRKEKQRGKEQFFQLLRNGAQYFYNILVKIGDTQV